MSKKIPKNTLNKMFSFMFPSFELAWKDETPGIEELHSWEAGGVSLPHSPEEHIVYFTIRRALEKYPLGSDDEYNELKPTEKEAFELWYKKALKKFCSLCLLHGKTSLEMEYSYATSALLDPNTFFMSFGRPWKDSFSYARIPDFYKKHDS
jgi:hypothetical protein